MNVNDPFEISDYQFPPGAIKVFDICHALSRVAGQHAGLLGIMDHFIAERETGWIILSFSLRLLDAKPVQGSVRLQTWIAAIEGASLIREFRIVANNPDGSRSTIAEAAQGFIPFDRTTRRPILLAKEQRDTLSGNGRTFSFKENPERRRAKALIPATEPTQSFVVTVGAKDVDVNGHVNNAKYLEWVSEKNDLPSSRQREFTVEYLQEAKLDDQIEIKYWILDDQRSFFSFNIRETGVLSAIVRTI